MSFQQKPKFPPKITAKGTELPLMDLKNKPYLQVAHRLVWFREEHPAGSIMTELVQVSDTACLAKATITLPLSDGRMIIVAVGHKRESADNFGDFIEKAETGAIGRALAMAGYGTQFEPELDEGERIVDSPMMVATRPAAKGADEEQPGPRAEDNGRIAAQGPKPAQAATISAKRGPKAEASPVTESDGGAGVPAEPPSDRNTLNRKQTVAETKASMKTRYGTDNNKELTDEQAREFYSVLRGLI
jgi:hypothetical protein